MENENGITLYAAEEYKVYSVGNVDRSMTIAAFYVAQEIGEEEYSAGKSVDSSPMRRDVLRHLIFDSAIGYWLKTKHWLEKCPHDKDWLQLTNTGINEVKNSYDTQRSKNIATTNEVSRWINWMLNSDVKTPISKTFTLPIQWKIFNTSGKRTKEEALRVLSGYYKENKSWLPKDISKSRDKIIDYLMDGIAAAEAFSLAASPPKLKGDQL